MYSLVSHTKFYFYLLFKFTPESNNLHGKLPEELSALSYLEKLNLADNSISGSIPSTMLSNDKPSSLVSLDLSSNQLSSSIPLSLYNQQLLKTLKVGDNALTGSISDGVRHLYSLVEFNISHNLFHGRLIPNGILSPSEYAVWNANIFRSSRSTLKILDISNNRLTGQLFRTDLDFKALHTLIMDQNSLVGTIHNDRLHDFVSLSTLSFSANEITGTIPESIGDLKSLRNLNIGQNQLTGTIPTNLGNLRNLEVLDVSENQLKGQLPTELGSSGRLERLVLNDNKFSGTIPEAFSTMTSLGKYYDLSNGHRRYVSVIWSILISWFLIASRTTQLVHTFSGMIS